MGRWRARLGDGPKPRQPQGVGKPGFHLEWSTQWPLLGKMNTNPSPSEFHFSFQKSDQVQGIQVVHLGSLAYS